jgi:hypothetical protein
VLFGGYGYGLPTLLSDTWEWDGIDWSLRTPSASPTPRSGHAMAYDSARSRVVLFGGGQLSDTWEWNGSNWAERFPSDAPAGRSSHALAYDSARGRQVLFGGGSGGYLSDTWEYFAPCDVLGPGHPGAGLPIVCLTPPRVGTTSCIGFMNPSPSAVGFNLLLLAPGSGLNPPLRVSPPAVCAEAFLYVLPHVVLSALGNPAGFCLAIPPAPSLVGAAFATQGVSLEQGVCFRATDGLVLTVQP